MDELWKVLMHDNRKNVPSREGFLDYMLLLLTKEHRFDRAAFYEVDPSKRFVRPILVMGPDTGEEHAVLGEKLKDVSLDIILGEDRSEKVELRTSPSLENRFKAYTIPLDFPSRFKESYTAGESFFGVDKEGYQPTEVDKKIGEIFGTDEYALITVKGRGEEIIGWFYVDYRFTKGDLSKIDKEEIRHIEAITSSKLQTIRNYEARKESEQSALVARIVATLIHEYRNAVMSMGGFANYLLRKSTEYLEDGSESNKNTLVKSLKKYLPIIINEAKRLEGDVKKISDFSIQKLKGNYTVVNVYDLLEEAVNSANGNGQKYTIEGGDEVKIWTDPILFRAAALGLAENAFEAIRHDKNKGELTVNVTTDNRFSYSNFHNPQCIHPDTYKNVFYPFYSTKGIGNPGLGLVIAQRCMSAINGDLSLKTDPQEGTTTTLKSPLYRG